MSKEKNNKISSAIDCTKSERKSNVHRLTFDSSVHSLDQESDLIVPSTPEFSLNIEFSEDDSPRRVREYNNKDKVSCL